MIWVPFLYICVAKVGLIRTTGIVLVVFSILSFTILCYQADVFSPTQLVSVSIQHEDDESQPQPTTYHDPNLVKTQSLPFNYPLYMDCYIHNYPKPIPYHQDDMLQVRDIWVWPDVSHITIQHERLSLCERNYKYEIWNRNYSCTYYTYNAQTNTFTPLHLTTYASTQNRQVHAQHLFIDCPIPKHTDYNFIQLINNTYAEYIPQLFVAVAPVHINQTTTQFNTAGMVNSTVFLPVCLHTIGNRNNNQIITHKLIDSMDAKDMTYPYTLSACTMITSDAYIDARFNSSVSDAVYRVIEWIEFHLMVGFEHFFIYDNSLDNCVRGACSMLYKVLLPYIHTGIVTYVYWPAPFCNVFFDGLAQWRRWGPQIAGFNSCIGRFGSMTKWMSVHDVDEFFVPLGPYHGIDALIRKMGKDVNSVGFVQKLLINCTNLKYGNHEEYEDKSRMISILSHYQCAFRTLEPKNKKLLIRPLRMRSILIHFPTYFYPGYEAHKYLLNATNEAVMYHARTSSMFGKNDYYVLPPDETMFYWFDKLHRRLAKQRLIIEKL